MGAAIEVITGQATNPGATITQLTANSGDSYAVRSTDVAADIELWNAWAFTTTNLLMRIRSPRMHDQAQNWRGQPPASTPRPLIGLQPSQRLYSQDNIIVEGARSNRSSKTSRPWKSIRSAAPRPATTARRWRSTARSTR